VGCRVVTNVGNNGTFYYPKLDLLATVVLLEDCINLPYANPEAKEKIITFREKPVGVIKDKAPVRRIEIEIHYDLVIANK